MENAELRETIMTKDGSHTIAVPAMKVTYHSIHGAVQESRHVFIEAGLKFLVEHSTFKQINIFEMGFGTALNALLTAIEAQKLELKVQYTTVEQYPLTIQQVRQLNYGTQLHQQELFLSLHKIDWNDEINITPHFSVDKQHTTMENYLTQFGGSAQLPGNAAVQLFHLIYYDAFAPTAQPELWTEDVFRKLYNILVDGGVLVTYCSKGDVRRAMKAAGFEVEKLQGPPGKREMLRAQKVSRSG